MSIITDLINKIREKRQNTITSDHIDDNVTRDKYLRSLRREKRILDEAEEKKALQAEIAERRKQHMREHLYGLKTEVQKKALIASKLREDVSLITGNRVNKKSNSNSGFLGKSNL